MTVVSGEIQKSLPVVQCICCPRKVSPKDAWYFMGIRPEMTFEAKDNFGPLCKVCYEQLKAVIQLALRPVRGKVSYT